MNEPELSIFAERLKKTRADLNLSQADFVDGIGITAASLSAYEKNLKTPSIGIVKRIAEKYNISIDWLCGLSEIEKVNQGVKTYSDVFRLLLELNDYVGLFISIDLGRQHSEEESLSSLVFYDKNVKTFLSDWSKMQRLFYDKSIDVDVYNLWVEKTLKKYDFPIESDLPF